MGKNQEALKRALQMAGMTAGVTGSYIGYLAQHLFLDKDERDRVLKRTHARAGRRMTAKMAQLRGPAMKLGQTLSLQTGILPDQALAELAALQISAPPMHPSLLRAIFRTEFGRDPEELFRRFDPVPFAAASLGQVHRAESRSGQRLAVKVQYPAIRQAIESDVRWFRAISKPAQFSKHLPPGVLDELQEQFVKETDYGAEADNIEFFGEKLKPLPWVEVPRVFREYSRDRVLTMSLLEGQHLDAFLATKPPQALRNLIGERLLELYYFQVLRLEAFHADPHWGNYLFRSDGTIGLVDFGCVKRLHPRFAANLRAVYLFPGDRDGAEFHRLLDDRYGIFGGRPNPQARRALVHFSKTFYSKYYPPEPEKEQIPIDFSDPELIRLYMREATLLANSRGAAPEYLFLSRAETACTALCTGCEHACAPAPSSGAGRMWETAEAAPRRRANLSRHAFCV
jgi:predicted unusual protein kinase regulating ubiquinone biosynthesis (AarF/ABC1/UbiB family)